MLSLIWEPEGLSCFYFSSFLQGSDDSEMGASLFSFGGGNTVQSGFRVTPRVASGRWPLLCGVREASHAHGEQPQGEMCEDLLAFKAFICKYWFSHALLVLWAL